MSNTNTPNHNSNEPNGLIHANSPYLLQHAFNPVAWEEWSETTWQRAKTENKLVVVSIGYSTCHWCHVMEHESFEDFATAEIMNHHLISIKVDREERPDIDMIYMDACQLMTGRGGWPLNVICLPNMQPIYAGTYFPKKQWQEIIEQLATVYREEPSKAVDYAQKIQEKIALMNRIESGNDVTRQDIVNHFPTLANNLDWVEGGPNRAPKFPLPGQYEFILDYHLLTESESAKDFLHLSLLKMSNGGIYDTLRGGFCRYSTDAMWFAPHFEKMLYDNAQLISLYARAFSWSDAPLYKTIAEECITFCERELRIEKNKKTTGYGSALDADSEGVEGLFYVFTHEELITILSEEDMQLATVQFGLSNEGNWEHGYNILHQPLAPLQVLEKTGLVVHEYLDRLKHIKQKLKNYQDTRIRPSFDDKVICSWNALYLKALADASFYLQNSEYQEKAEDLAHWMWDIFWQKSSLLRIYRNEKTSIQAFLEDYAYFSDAFLSLYKISRNPIHLNRAKQLIETAIDLFYDADSQQLAFTPKDGEALFFRKSDVNDDVTASPNSVLAHCLFQIGLMQGNLDYISLSKQLMLQISKSMNQSPGWYFNWSRLAQAQTLGGLHIIFHEAPSQINGEWSQFEILTMAKQLPSWTTFEFKSNVGISSAIHIESQFEIDSSIETDSESNNNSAMYAHREIVVCCNHTCHPPVNRIDQALEIAKDGCTLMN